MDWPSSYLPDTYGIPVSGRQSIGISPRLSSEAVKDGVARLWTVGDVGVARVAESGIPS